MRIVIFYIIVFMIPALAFTKTIHVPGDYNKIQEAIDVVVNGDTVLVDPGTYVENINFIGKAITVVSELGPYATTINGNETDSVVTCESGEGNNSILDGFTIRNGRGNWSPFSRGGGIYCKISSPTIRNNFIFDNWAEKGGGISCYISSPVITNNSIIQNNVENHSGWAQGGGIYCEGGSPTILNNIINANVAIGWMETATSGYGGGVHFQGVNMAVFKDNFVRDNTANRLGDGIASDDSSILFTNNIIIERNDDTLFCMRSTLDIKNCTFYGKSFYLQCSSYLFVNNSIFWHDTPITITLGYNQMPPATLHITHSDIKGGQPAINVISPSTLIWGPGNINSDPFFADEPTLDFHITLTSPCRNAGSNIIGLPTEDFEGDPRIHEGTVDIGADEFYPHFYTIPPSVGQGGKVDLRVVGPHATPVDLYIGTTVLDPPIPTQWGLWYLEYPYQGPYYLGITDLNGTLSVTSYLTGISGSYFIPMQTMIGSELSNLCELVIY